MIRAAHLFLGMAIGVAALAGAVTSQTAPAPISAEAVSQAKELADAVLLQLQSLDQMIASQDAYLTELLALAEQTKDQGQKAQMTASAERLSNALDALEDQRNQMAEKLEILQAALTTAAQGPDMADKAP